MYSRFIARKTSVEQRLTSLKAALAQHQRNNRALRIGRAPRLLIDTLNRLEQVGLAAHFVAVGTHALYAYESACGVRVQADAKSDATATQDIDLLLDTRKYLSFVTHWRCTTCATHPQSRVQSPRGIGCIMRGQDPGAVLQQTKTDYDPRATLSAFTLPWLHLSFGKCCSDKPSHL